MRAVPARAGVPGPNVGAIGPPLLLRNAVPVTIPIASPLAHGFQAATVARSAGRLTDAAS